VFLALLVLLALQALLALLALHAIPLRFYQLVCPKQR
jgi:hypothetical protein